MSKSRHGRQLSRAREMLTDTSRDLVESRRRVRVLEKQLAIVRARKDRSDLYKATLERIVDTGDEHSARIARKALDGS